MGFVPAVSDTMAEPRSILILYGSQSGNSEELAEQAGKACSNHNLIADVKSMEDVQITDLQSQKRVLVCCSTWGDGEQPDNAEDLWEAANSGAISSLSGLNFSVLALGDTSYDLFCESGKEWDAWFEKMGASRVHQRVDCDVDYEQPAAEWIAAVIPKMADIEDDVSEIEDNSSESVAPEANIEPPKQAAAKKDKSQWSAKNPYSSHLTENYVLNGDGSGKETRHIVFDLGDSGMEYKAGDALGVIPSCPPELVQELLDASNLNGDEIVETHQGEKTITEALSDYYEIHRVSKKWILNLEERVTSEKPLEIKISSRKRVSTKDGVLIEDWTSSDEAGDSPDGYQEIGVALNPAETLWRDLSENSESMEDYQWSRDYVDALQDFGHLGFTAQQLVNGMDRLKPRLYSIASSPDFEPGKVHLTVGIVRYNHHDRDRTGLATGYLADRCSVYYKSKIDVFMSPTRSFVLPEDGSKDCIMVGPGTGIAPFRAFLQQRDLNGDTGRNWLFFGDWTEEGEYYYKEEMESWKERGILDKHDLAWSRQGSEKVYVQHLMKKNGEEIWNWIDGGGYFYVCGDKNYMAKDVHSTLIEICSEFGGMTSDEAKDFVETKLMKTEKRYLRDVY
ncbi:MAG: sulfite reductase subunit alpha [Euryarchaeota archaeon]|nr:sulfite reductase subunit alpha [Euryarchaeota archaeon]